MPKVKIYNQKAEEVGELKLSDKIFNVELNSALVHQAMVTQMANERQVLAHTKTKANVRGGGKKPWKQKGTGRARAGSSRSPIWVGGGVTFGPLKERNFSKKINKKMKQKAIFMTLSDRFMSGNLIVLDNFEMAEFKTKTFDGVLKNIEKKILKSETKAKKRSVLVVNGSRDEKTKKSGKNLPGVEIINSDNINIIDLLKYKNLILTQEAVNKIEKIYSK